MSYPYAQDYLANSIYLLPDALSNVVFDAGRQLGAPKSIIVTSLLSSLSTAIHGHVDVEAPFGQLLPTSIFTCVIAESGERKSSTDRLMSAPLLALEQKIIQAGSASNAERAMVRDSWNTKKRLLQRRLEKSMSEGDTVAQEKFQQELTDLYLEEPTAQSVSDKIFINDTTATALYANLAGEGQVLTLASSDAANLLSRSNTDFVSNVNRLWDGEGLMITRMSGDTIIKGARLAINIMIQPRVLESIFRRKEDLLRISGYFSRMLVTRPQSTMGTRQNIGMGSENSKFIAQFHHRLECLMKESLVHQAEGARVRLYFSASAKEFLAEFQNELESRIHPHADMAEISDAASKTINNVCRIAALVHVYEHGTQELKISWDTTALAAQLMRFYLNEFQLLFREKTIEDEARELGDLLFKWLQRNGYYAQSAFIPLTQILQYGPNRMRKKEKAMLAIQYLSATEDIVAFLNHRPPSIQAVQPRLQQRHIRQM